MNKNKSKVTWVERLPDGKYKITQHRYDACGFISKANSDGSAEVVFTDGGGTIVAKLEAAEFVGGLSV